MKVCIAGGGKVGMYLAQSLLAHRHKVTIIEPQEMLCRSLADSLDIPVICGDAISFDTMRTADVASCDAFVAVTGADENNLVACQIAKREFGVNRTVARASNPKNRELLHTLGVDTVVCGTDNLSHILEREIETDTIRQLLLAGRRHCQPERNFAAGELPVCRAGGQGHPHAGRRHSGVHHPRCGVHHPPRQYHLTAVGPHPLPDAG